MSTNRLNVGAAVIATLCIGASGLLPGCARQNQPIGAEPDNVPRGRYPQVVLDNALASFVGVDYDGVIVDPANDGTPMRVEVPVRSLAEAGQMVVQYRYSWMDAMGRSVGDSGWRTQTMEARWRGRFVGNSSSLKAANWQLEIRSAR